MFSLLPAARAARAATAATGRQYAHLFGPVNGKTLTVARRPRYSARITEKSAKSAKGGPPLIDPENSPPAPPATFDPAAVAAVVTAYRRTVAALDALGAALAAAGALDTGPRRPPVTLPAPAPPAGDGRPRSTAAERQRRWRERHRAAGSVTPAVTPAVTSNAPAAPAPARAFLIGDTKKEPHIADAISAPLALPVTPPVTPVTPPVTPPAPAAPPLTLTAPGVDPAPAGRPQERPAVARGRKNAPRPDSAPVAGAESAPRAASDRAADVATVWAAYSAATVAAVRLTPGRRALIERRLSEGWSAADLARACEGYARSPWHRGDNPNGRPYQALELWLRDAAHIEAGQAMIDRPPAVARPGRPALDGIADAWSEEQAAADRAAVAAPAPVDPAEYDPFLAYS